MAADVTLAPSAEPKIGRPFKFQDITAFQAAVDAYFAQCDEDKRPYTMSGLANALGTTRQTLLAYEGEREGRHSPSDDFVRAVKAARGRCEQFAEESLWGKAHPAGPIFSLKNNYGWRDEQQVNHAHAHVIAVGALPPQREPLLVSEAPAKVELLEATFASKVSADS